MKSFLVLLALVAVCAASAVREKRGYSLGYSGLGGYYGGHYGSYYSVPHVVSVKHVAPISYGYSGYGHGYGHGYSHGYNHGYGHGIGHGYGHGYGGLYSHGHGWW